MKKRHQVMMSQMNIVSKRKEKTKKRTKQGFGCALSFITPSFIVRHRSFLMMDQRTISLERNNRLFDWQKNIKIKNIFSNQSQSPKYILV